MKNQKKQNFLEFLKEQNEKNPETLIYFGMKDGSSWLAIETPQTLIDKMKHMDDKLKKRAVDTLNKAKRRLIDIPAELIKAREDLLKLESDPKSDREDIAKAKSKIADLEKGFVSAFQTRNKYIPYVTYWTELDKRIVINSYPHTVDDPGLSVLVEGFETGDLWKRGELDDKGKVRRSLID